MPVWCPSCRAMLPEGQKKCPACGAKISSGDGDSFSCSEIFSISIYILGIVLVPLLVAAAIGLLCVIFIL